MSAPKDPAKREEWLRKQSETHIGRHHSEESKNKISISQKGKPKKPFTKEHCENISKSATGRVPWNKGIPHTEESKEKMRQKKLGIPLSEDHKKHLSESHKGQTPHVTPESIEKNRIAHLGKKLSEETKRKMSVSRKGRKVWNKGIPSSETAKRNQSIALTGKPKTMEHRKNMSGARNHNWKGGVSQLDKAIRELPEMYIWKYNVMKRDNFRDCFTGIRGNHNLEVHHIKPLAIIIQEYNIKTIEDALNCKELWDTNNGVTMFKESHIEHHKKYGLKVLPKEYYFQKRN